MTQQTLTAEVPLREASRAACAAAVEGTCGSRHCGAPQEPQTGSADTSRKLQGGDPQTHKGICQSLPQKTHFGQQRPPAEWHSGSSPI